VTTTIKGTTMFGLTNTIAIKIGEWLIVLAVMAGVGYYIYHEGYEAKSKEDIVAQAASDKLATEKYNKIAAELEVSKAARDVVTKTIVKTVTKLVDRPVYSSVCLDQDGVDVANKAIKGVASE